MKTNSTVNPEDIHVWQARFSDLDAHYAAFSALLSADEQRRAQRYLDAAVGRRYALARGLLRSVLGQYLKEAPAAIVFDYGPRGKPSLPDTLLTFNLAHAGNMILIALASGRRIGVDVEKIRPMEVMATVVDDYFSTQEQAVWHALPPAEQMPAFYRCWTRKEAFIKATGDGFAHPLTAFDVTLDDPPYLLRSEYDTPQHWSLVHLEPAPGYVGALCVEGGILALHHFRESALQGIYDTMS